MPALQRPHVLIVSDDDDLTAFLGEGLVYAGFWTSLIASAMQTLEVLRLRTFDLVAIDAALGGMGAEELVRRLRGRSSRSPTKARTDVPILAIVSAVESESAPLLEAGASEVIGAPIELDDLALVLFRLVNQWRDQHPDRPWADDVAQAPL